MSRSQGGVNAVAEDFNTPRSVDLEALHHLHHKEALPIISSLEKLPKLGKTYGGTTDS